MNGHHCLITGASGFVGKHLATCLRDSGRGVVSLSKDGLPDQSSFVADLGAGEVDLSSARVGFEEVYHLAGMAHIVPRTQEERELFFHVNVNGTSNLLRSIERTGRLPERLIFVSSVAVYGVEEGWMLNEDTPRGATDPYGLSKRQAEDLLTEWCYKNSVRLGIVRLPLVAGKNPPGNLGMMIHAMTRGWYVSIGPGTARRSIVLAEDVSRILPRVAANGGVFHLTDGCHPSIGEIEVALASTLKKRNPLRLPMWVARAGAVVGDRCRQLTGFSLPFDSRILRKMTSTLTFSDEKARSLLGWKPSSFLDRLPDLV
jgi:nucleoside-diphosphate-sugar epimerase